MGIDLRVRGIRPGFYAGRVNPPQQTGRLIRATLLTKRFVGGFTLAGVALAAAHGLLVTRSDPQPFPGPAVAFVTHLPFPATEPEKYGPTLNAEVMVRPRIIGNCNPVRVRVEVDTVTLGAARGDVPAKASQFALTVVGRRPVERLSLYDTGLGIPKARLRKAKTVRRVTFPGGRGAGGTATTWTGTISEWPVEPYPPSLGFQFKADWAERRGAGECFLHLPQLLGSAEVRSAAYEAADAIGGEPAVRRVVGNHSALEGSSTPVVVGGAVSRGPEESIPPPSDPTRGRWECQVIETGRTLAREVLAIMTQS